MEKEKKENKPNESEQTKKTEQVKEEVKPKAKGEAEIEKLKAEVEDYKDKWMRSVAEFDNYKKRNSKLWQDAFNEGLSSVIVKILPVGDNLEYALSIGLDEKTEEGIKGIIKKFNETLKTMDVEEINPLGKKFDPEIAEAVMMVEKENENEESETVKQVFQKGYKIKDKIIRYAKVSVIK